MSRLGVLSLILGLASLSCSSSTTPPVAAANDTGTVEEDTAPVEDTAPWNTYPEGPYGFAAGQVFPNLSFKGYREGTGEWTDISMIEFYDPDGSRGITGVYFVVSAEWCPPCREEAKDLPGFYTNQFKPRGAKFITAVIEDSKQNPATQTVVDRWLAAYHLNFDTVEDGDRASLPKTGSVGLPYNYVINPRDMKVFRVVQGVNPDAVTIGPLNTLLKANGAPAYDGGGV